MDKTWICADRMTKEYESGVLEFVKYAVQHAENPRRMHCPCLRCCYIGKVDAHGLKSHLLRHGIDQSYQCWIFHGEKINENVESSGKSNTTYASYDKDTETYDCDRVEEIVEALEEDLHDCPEMFERMVSDAEKPLYKGCTKFSRLSAVLKLYNLKAGNGWSDKSFTELLALMREMLPDDNVLPNRTYEAKKMLCSIGMSYDKIHACPNDCILFRNEYAMLTECPKCGLSRYKKRLSPAKVLWYFPIIPRFRRMFRSETDARHLTWHADERIIDGKYRHPADSPQWSKIDNDYPEFGSEARNLRLALSTDGMNPHGLQSISHTTWPVILMIYNLPPWLCMKRKYMMLSLLISGPKQPGNDIDVYLTPLIEDLKILWENGVEVYDGYRKESFNLRAMLFGTINDFPAYGNLSGYSIKGQRACPVCEDGTDTIRLELCQKNVFLGHRRFLHSKHHYRGWRKAFNGDTEHRRAPPALSGEQVFEKVKDVRTEFGKPFAHKIVKGGWKKRSIFFELPYWKSLYVRHFLDVMHIEKNVFESVIGTLLNIKGKSKDGLKAREDMLKMGMRTELAPVKKGRRTYLPPAAFTLSRKEKKNLCKSLSEVKVPEGYSSDIRRLVSMKDLKLKNLKTHDCHVIMEHFLPIGIRSILPEKVRSAITKLCFFFRSICSKVIDPEILPTLQKEIVITLCELEMYFPPSFFDIMVHLVVHLVKETQLCGPAYMRWMYPAERYMKILKGYVKSRSRPEGCIVERYIVEEAVEFCTEYLSNVQSIGLPRAQIFDKMEGKKLIGNKIVTISRDERDQVHLYVLHNNNEVEPYVEMHKDVLRRLNPNRNENWIVIEHNQSFIQWLKDHIYLKRSSDPSSVTEMLRCLAYGPSLHVFSHSAYSINGYTFYTKEQDDKSTMQNSGVTVLAEAMHISSMKDLNPKYANLSYFGVIEHIWVFDYEKFQIPIFGCKWVNSSGIRMDKSGFLQVDLTRVGYKDEPFILASQAKQVFYVNDPKSTKWSIVLFSNKVTDDSGVDQCDIDVENESCIRRNELNRNDEVEDLIPDESYIRNDHNEGIWINSSVRIAKKQVINIPTKKRKRC